MDVIHMIDNMIGNIIDKDFKGDAGRVVDFDYVGFGHVGFDGFDTPKDDRVHNSLVADVDDGDSFDEYAEWFYGQYGEDLFDDLQDVVC